MLIASEQTVKQFPPAPEGMHLARCISVIDMGTQQSLMFNKWTRKVRIGFELPEEKQVFDEQRGAEPYVVSQGFSLSLDSKSNLRKFLKGWRGRDFTSEELKAFDLKTILDKPCMLTIGHKTKTTDGSERTYAEIVGIGPLMKSMTSPDRVMPLTVYEIEQGKDAIFEALPDWIKKQIGQCQEWNPPKPNGTKIDPADVPVNMPHVARETVPADTEDEPPFAWIPPILPWIAGTSATLFC